MVNVCCVMLYDILNCFLCCYENLLKNDFVVLSVLWCVYVVVVVCVVFVF